MVLRETSTVLYNLSHEISTVLQSRHKLFLLLNFFSDGLEIQLSELGQWSSRRNFHLGVFFSALLDYF